MTRLLNFTRTQEIRRDRVFLCFGMKKKEGLYSSGGENMNERSLHGKTFDLLTLDLSSEAMLQGGKVLNPTLSSETGFLDYGGQHSYHIIQYVNQVTCVCM